MSERVSRSAPPPSHPLPDGPPHHARSHLIISSRLARPHILITGVIFPNAPFSVAHSTPMPSSPRPAGHPAKTPSAAHASWQSSQRPAPRQAQRGERRDEKIACWLCSSHRSSCLVSVAAAYRPQCFPSRGGVNSRGIIPRRFPQLTTSAPYHRLIASSIPPHPSNSPPLNPGKQARQGSGRPSAPSSYSRLVSSSHRPVSPLVSAGGAKSVSFPSVPCRHRARASQHRSPWLKRFNHSSA